MIVCLVLAMAFFILRSYTNPLALSGLTTDQSPAYIVMSDTTLTVPRNMIRFRDQRQQSHLTKLDLFVHWPTMRGFTEEGAAIFENTAGMDELIFISLEAGKPLNSAEQKLSGLYRKFFIKSPKRGPAGLIAHELDPSSGYLSEDVLYAKQNDRLFLTRCLREDSAHQKDLRPTCLYEFTFSKGINVVVRFHRSLLKEWKEFDGSIRRLLSSFSQ